MSILRDLLTITEDKATTAAASVYHRDYVKTRNKKYRKYDPRKRKPVNENLTPEEINQALDMLGTPDADEHALRHDLKLLKKLSEKTKPSKIVVSKGDPHHVVTFQYDNADGHQLFTSYKEMFGNPVNKSIKDTETNAHFHDKDTGTDVTLSKGSDKKLNAKFNLKTGNTFTESQSFKSFLLDQAPVDPIDYQAKPFQDDSTTSKLVSIRSALTQHLNADDKAKQLFMQSIDINQAKQRLVAIMRTLPQSAGLLPSEIEQVAEEVADVYWNR